MRSRARYSSLLCGTAMAVVTMAAAPAFAEGKPINIEPQSLATALREFASQSQQAILVAPSLADGKSSQGVHDTADPEVALAQLLQGTGLTWRRSGEALLIVSASDPQSGSAAGDGADQGTVQALVVTAQKREENIQDVPIAMSAFTQEDLTRSQVAGGPDLMTQVPNFTFTKTNFTGYSIQIRGIGTQAVSATVDPAVAVAFNNTPFIRNRFFEQEFYDLQRVEVLRGPQGTLYGRNATAGVVNLISAKPTNHFEAKLSADVANYKSTRLEGMLNIPLAEDKAALRVAGAWTKREGFVTNTIAGEQTDGRDLWSARVTLGLTPVDWFSANLIYEHFSENDDRLRSGKQLCHNDPGPGEINGTPIVPTGDPAFGGVAALVYWSQGCLPASLYSPDSFEVPNGFALPYAAASGLINAPIHYDADPYLNATQSRNLREIETWFKPEYTATNDTAELQLSFDLPRNLTLASETGFNRDTIFSFEDFNRFNTRPGIFISDGSYPVVRPDGFVCNPQLGCSDRLAAGDLSTAKSLQFSQEFRLSSDYEGPFNLSLGANFLRYNTEDKYYIFFNTLGAAFKWSDNNTNCFSQDYQGLGTDMRGYAYGDPTDVYPTGGFGCAFEDRNDIHHLNDLGRNYFLSKNPYRLMSYAVFGEAYYEITPRLKITAGLRWTDDRKIAPQIPSWLLASESYGLPTLKVIHQEWKEPTGRLAIDWKPDLSFTDETLLYASYVHGYKAGGANPPGYVVTGVPVNYPFKEAAADSLVHPETFDAEFVDAYEIGTKNTLLDGRLTFNLNAFYYDYTGYQISQIVERSAVNLNFDAEIWGAELVADWRPLDNLRLGFKGGYENTRLADGSTAIDLIDRAAGMPGWLVKRPFPTIPSNCVIPLAYAFDYDCFSYQLEDPTFPFVPPNGGEGFAKDISGNQLPNAPQFTATITADYTLPLPREWLMTLHTDLYYQSEAWTRVFNTEGYDKLKAYTNVNVAAIFTNEDAGWTVMAYVKNVLDKDNITGAFLNSDDTGLTTNVFLNEPRLYGLRVTRAWNGSEWWSSHANRSGWYPYRLEFIGDYGRTSGGRELFVPDAIAYAPPDQPYPLGVQNNLDWGSGGGVKFVYQPTAGSWSFSAGVRYGRARGGAEEHPQWRVPGGYAVNGQKYVDPNEILTNPLGNYATTIGRNEESHAIADFTVGSDVGLGSWMNAAGGHLDFGLEYAKFRSSSNAELHGRPDVEFPEDNIIKYGGHWHRFWGEIEAQREFQGAGPSVSWVQSFPIIGNVDKAGRVDVDLGLGGSVLFGRQKSQASGWVKGDYHTGVLTFFPKYLQQLDVYETPFSYRRSKSATVPSVNANLGLSYTLGGLKLSGGYRIERYFDAIDAGIAERKTYDRQFDGPYMKVSIGFGG